MANLNILIGYGESGKTTYANNMDNVKQIFFDTFPVYENKEKFEFSMKLIADKCNKELKDEDVILDGYLSVINKEIMEPDFKTLKENLKHHNIKPIVIFTDADIIVKRIKERNPVCNPDNVDKRFIVKTYELARTNFNLLDAEFYWAKDNEFVKVESCREVMEIVSGIKENEVPKFIDKFDSIKEEKKNETNYDSKYQTMRFPFGMYRQGYAGYENETWNGIKDLIDWKDKTVADIGCLNGYYSFKIADRRAKAVRGYDLFQQACDTCKEIARLNCFENVKFKQLDANKDELGLNFDVILLLNMLHHLETPENILNEAFERGKNVILEVQFDGFSSNIQKDGGAERMIKNTKDWDKEVIIRLASTHGHKLVKVNPSGRPYRYILHFKK